MWSSRQLLQKPFKRQQVQRLTNFQCRLWQALQINQGGCMGRDAP